MTHPCQMGSPSPSPVIDANILTDLLYIHVYVIYLNIFFLFRSFAYLTICDRMPVILTKVIDLVHRRASAFSEENQQVVFFSGLL